MPVRTSTSFDGVSHGTPFATRSDEDWDELRIAFDAFIPTFRGRRVVDHPALDPAAIRTFGLIVADRQVGNFQLQTDWIRAYRDETRQP